MIRLEHRSRIYYDIDRAGRGLALTIHDPAEEIHAHVVQFANAHSRFDVLPP